MNVLEAAEKRVGKITWSGASGPDPEQNFAYAGQGDDFVKLVNGEINYLPEVITTNCSGAVMSVLLDAGLITVEQVRKEFAHLQRIALAAKEETTSSIEPFKIWYQGFKVFLGLEKSSALFTEHTLPPDPRLLFPIKMTEFRLNSELNKPGSLIFCHGLEESSSLIHIAICTGELNRDSSPMIYSLESNAPWQKRALNEVPLFSGFHRNYSYATR